MRLKVAMKNQGLLTTELKDGYKKMYSICKDDETGNFILTVKNTIYKIKK